MIDRIDHLSGLMRRVGDRHPQARALIERKSLAARGHVPHVAQHLQQEGARRLQPRLGDPGEHLDGRVVAQDLRRVARRLLARQCHEGVERGARDAERHAGKRDAEHLVDRDAVERPFSRRSAVRSRVKE